VLSYPSLIPTALERVKVGRKSKAPEWSLTSKSPWVVAILRLFANPESKNLRVLATVSGVILHLFRWAEACPCHGHLDWAQATFDQRRAWERCPMRGRRAPDMVAGVFGDTLEAHLAISAVELLGLLPRGLDAASRAILLRDFERAKDHLRFVFAVRLQHWDQLPCLIFGAAYHDDEISRLCVELGLVEPSEHPRLKLLKTELREEAESYVTGTPLVDLPLLREYIAAMKFIPTAERSIEGEHAKVEGNG